MKKIAELLYQAYYEKYSTDFIEVEGLDEAEQEFLKSLNKQQFHLFLDLECLYIEYKKLHELRAIQFVLELLQPKED